MSGRDRGKIAYSIFPWPTERRTHKGHSTEGTATNPVLLVIHQDNENGNIKMKLLFFEKRSFLALSNEEVWRQWHWVAMSIPNIQILCPNTIYLWEEAGFFRKCLVIGLGQGEYGCEPEIFCYARKRESTQSIERT